MTPPRAHPGVRCAYATGRRKKSGSGESRCPKMTDLRRNAYDQTCPRIDLRIGWAPEGVLRLVGKPASCSRGRKSSIFELGLETGNPSIQRLEVLHCLRSKQTFQQGLRRGGSAHRAVSLSAQLIFIDPILQWLHEPEAAALRKARANQKKRD